MSFKEFTIPYYKPKYVSQLKLTYAISHISVQIYKISCQYFDLTNFKIYYSESDFQ